MESEADETARRRKFFNTIDTDGDGTITVSELQSRLKDMSRMIGGPVIDDKIAQKYGLVLKLIGFFGLRWGRY